MAYDGNGRISNDSNRKTSALELYLKDITYNNLLTHEQEIELAKRIRAGDRKALEQMIKSNLRFVITIAKHYQGRGLPLEDLIAEGNFGLVRAATRYDEEKGVKFTTYGVWWIRQGILKALSENARMVRLPVNKIKHITKLERLESNLQQESCREPSVDEIAERTEMNPKQVQNLLNASRLHISLDTPIDEYEKPLLEILEDKDQTAPDYPLMEQSLKDGIEAALDTLEPRESRILRLLFGINREETMTYEQVGTILGLSKERIRQIKNDALRNLRSIQKREEVEPLRTYLQED